MTHITLPGDERPLVSVVMVTFGSRDWAERALAQLGEHAEAPLEVIVVDNDSPDGTGAWLTEHVGGATVLLNDRNTGFASASNRGAAHARGRYLCFLNPDTLVQEGWLLPLLDTLDGDRTIAAVCPRLLNLDGSLQEAGSLVGREGATHALGQDADPGDVAFSFPLDVDYGSAACLLVRRSAFCEVGGFDAAYRPAYVEDVDLCLALSARGYRIAFQPAAAVVHAASVSVGVRSASRMILRNRGILLGRWGARLSERSWLQERRYFPHRVAAVRDHDTPDRILVMADRVPPPGDALRRVLEELGGIRHVRTTLVAPQGGEGDQDLARTGVEVVVGPRDWTEWFEERLFHFTAVLRAGSTGPWEELLRATQPHLTPGPFELREVKSLADLLADLGVAPSPQLLGVAS